MFLLASLHSHTYWWEKWNVMESRFFRVFYPAGLEDVAARTVAVGESSIRNIAEKLGGEYIPEDLKVPVVLMEPLQMPGGYTDPSEGRIVIYVAPSYDEAWGPTDWIGRVLPHELTHFLVFYLLSAPPRGWTQGITAVALPLWFHEGVAQEFGEGWDSLRDGIVRVDALSGLFYTPNQLESFYSMNGRGTLRGYYQSQAFLEYLLKSYGHDKFKRLMHVFRGIPVKSYREAIRKVYGKSLEELLLEFRRDAVKAFSRQVEGLPDAWKYERQSFYGDINLEPVCMDGNIFYLSNWGQDYQILSLVVEGPSVPKGRKVLARDVISGYSVKKVSDGYLIAYTSYALKQKGIVSPKLSLVWWDSRFKKSRTLKVSRKLAALSVQFPSLNPVYNRIVFSEYHRGNTRLFIADYIVSRGKFLLRNKTLISGNYSQAFEARWSPDGKRLVYVAIDGGRKKIVLYDADSGVSRELVSGSDDYRNPRWVSSDRFVFSSDAYPSFRNEPSYGRVGIFSTYMAVLSAEGEVRFYLLSRTLQNQFYPFAEPVPGKNGTCYNLYFSAYTSAGYQIFSVKTSPGREYHFPREGGRVLEKEKGAVDTYSPLPLVKRFAGSLTLDSTGRVGGLLYVEATDFLHKNNIKFFYFSDITGLPYYYFHYDTSMLPLPLSVSLYRFFEFVGFFSEYFYWRSFYGGEILTSVSTGMHSDLLFSYRWGDYSLSFHEYLIGPANVVHEESVNEVEFDHVYQKFKPTVDSAINPVGFYSDVSFAKSVIDSGWRLSVLLYGASDFPPSKNSVSGVLSTGVSNYPEEASYFWSGGSKIIRGIPPGELRGNVYVAGTLEYRYFLLDGRFASFLGTYLGSIYGVFFADGAMFFKTYEDAFLSEKPWELCESRATAGLEIRLNLLVGGVASLPVTLGWGWGLYPADSSGVFYFTFGVPFP